MEDERGETSSACYSDDVIRVREGDNFDLVCSMTLSRYIKKADTLWYVPFNGDPVQTVRDAASGLASNSKRVLLTNKV